MKIPAHYKFKEWWKKNWLFSLGCSFVALTFILIAIKIPYSYYYVESLEYANVDFEWADDFGNYEVVIIHEDNPHYLTISDDRVKFIYANDDLLNFVVIDYSKRICDGLNSYHVNKFYINLNYKENHND